MQSQPISYTDIPNAINALKPQVVSVEIIDSTLDTSDLRGSGFILRKNNKEYAVTNYHVIDSTLSENYMKGKFLAVGINSKLKKQYLLVDSIIYSINDDVAILVLSKFIYTINKYDKIDSSLYQSGVFIDTILQAGNKIVEGSSVLFIGFPLSLGKTFEGNTPVSRIGIVAQKVNKEKNTFLIDASASHGNSGSPVFDIVTYKLLGIIKRFEPDTAELVSEKGRLGVSLVTNSDLITCVSSDVILKLLPK